MSRMGRMRRMTCGPAIGFGRRGRSELGLRRMLVFYIGFSDLAL
jgi:hypothetical protein